MRQETLFKFTVVTEKQEKGQVTVWLKTLSPVVDRPITSGWRISKHKQKEKVERFTRAIEDGVVTKNPRVLTDVNGRTYVGFNSCVGARHLNADLKRLGY